MVITALLGASFPTTARCTEVQAENSGLANLRQPRSEFKAAGIFKTVHQRGQNYTEGDSQKSAR